MPVIEVRAFASRFESEEVRTEIIERITKAMADTYGEEVGRETEVILTGVPRSHWGFGGAVRE